MRGTGISTVSRDRATVSGCSTLHASVRCDSEGFAGFHRHQIDAVGVNPERNARLSTRRRRRISRRAGLSRRSRQPGREVMARVPSLAPGSGFLWPMTIYIYGNEQTHGERAAAAEAPTASGPVHLRLVAIETLEFGLFEGEARSLDDDEAEQLVEDASLCLALVVPPNSIRLWGKWARGS